MTKIFKVPFADQGNRVSIPDEAPSDGAVSYTQGYSEAYGRDQNEDPTARGIEREKMNGIFHDITGAIGEVQSFGAAQWNSNAYPYPLRALVYHNQKIWQSRIEDNKEEPKAGNAWVELKADLTADEVGAYSKEESNTRFQPKGNYAPAGNYALKGDSYTKPESDAKYQPVGSYLTAGYSYSKEESNGRFQPKGNYAPAGNYALKGDSYTKWESDSRYLQKYSGTRRTQEKTVWYGRVQDSGDMVCTENIAGCLVYIRLDNGQWMPLEVPVDSRVFITQWPAGWWGRIEFIPPSTLRWQDGAQIMVQVVLSK